MPATIAVLPGDGIGPEVTEQAVRVLRAAADAGGMDVHTETAPIGGTAYDATGDPLPAETLALCRRSAAALLGAVGGPRWDRLEPPSMRPEAGALLPLRRELGLYANLRPVRLHPALAGSSVLRPELTTSGVDLLIVRELAGGIYYGRKERSPDGRAAIDTCSYTSDEVERIAQVAFEAASRRRRRVCSVDKANVLETSRLWREVVTRLSADYPQVECSHMLVDNCAMQLIRDPSQFDVIVTDNMFGDILSDEASMLGGGIGMLPSASLGDGGFGLYEPVHGSAPDIAGRGLANPLGAIASVALMFRYSLRCDHAADLIERGLAAALAEGLRTADLARHGDRTVSTGQMGDAVLRSMAG